MGYVSLYRKYRPSNFFDVVGQEHIITTLTNQIKSGKIGHSYLFTGTRGTGKTSVARIFAKAVNCTSTLSCPPCGKCDTCINLAKEGNMDILEIDAASNNGVNEIRDIRDKVKYQPVYGKYKVYIIDEVHMLSAGAFNALLKTLEEPPAHAIFILATTEAHKLPQTILSRCMRFDFKLIPLEKIEKLLCYILDDINKEYEIEAVHAIAASGEGSARDAISLAEICYSYSLGKLTYLDVQEVIGASPKELLVELAKYVFSGQLSSLIELIDSLSRAGKNYTLVARDFANMLSNLLFIKNSSIANKYLKLPDDVYDMYKDLAVRYDTIKILYALETVSSLEASMRYTTQPKIAFQTVLARACIGGDIVDEAVLARIKGIEDKIETLSSIGITTQKKTEKIIEQSPEFKTTNSEKTKKAKEKSSKVSPLEIIEDKSPFDIIDDMPPCKIQIEKVEQKKHLDNKTTPITEVVAIDENIPNVFSNSVPINNYNASFTGSIELTKEELDAEVQFIISGVREIINEIDQSDIDNSSTNKCPNLKIVPDLLESSKCVINGQIFHVYPIDDYTYNILCDYEIMKKMKSYIKGISRVKLTHLEIEGVDIAGRKNKEIEYIKGFFDSNIIKVK